MISDEAVVNEAIESTAKSLAACYGVDWDEASDYERSRWTGTVARVMAGSWDEGYETCSRDEEDSYWGPRAVTKPNPYASQS